MGFVYVGHDVLGLLEHRLEVGGASVAPSGLGLSPWTCLLERPRLSYVGSGPCVSIGTQNWV